MIRLAWASVCSFLCVQATVVGFGEQGALLHVDVAAGDGRPVTLTAFVPLAELSWSRIRSAHDAVEVRAQAATCRMCLKATRIVYNDCTCVAMLTRSAWLLAVCCDHRSGRPATAAAAVIQRHKGGRMDW